MQMDYSKLRGRIVEKYGSITSFSKVCGINRSFFQQKLNCTTSFTQSDIINISNLLGITDEEIGKFFYTLSSTD